MNFYGYVKFIKYLELIYLVCTRIIYWFGLYYLYIYIYAYIVVYYFREIEKLEFYLFLAHRNFTMNY